MPRCQPEIEVKHNQLLVRSFKDSRFAAIPRRDLLNFSREQALSSVDRGMRPALEKALLWLDNHDLPLHWERDNLLGSDWENNYSDEDDSSEDEVSQEEKDHWIAQLYVFMDDHNTPINKAPSIANKDLDLYKLYQLVRQFGGFNKVTSQMKWRTIHSRMGLPPTNSSSSAIKAAYKKYLHAFEDFDRKLGSALVVIGSSGSRLSRQHLLSARERRASTALSGKESPTPNLSTNASSPLARAKGSPNKRAKTGQSHESVGDAVATDLSNLQPTESMVVEDCAVDRTSLVKKETTTGPR